MTAEHNLHTDPETKVKYLKSITAETTVTGGKYRLLDLPTNYGKRDKLYQLEALRDIPEHDVKKGDKGGYVEGPNNLSQLGSCWIAEEARVIQDARVGDQALVSGNAVVRSSARVSGNARVRGSAYMTDSSEARDSSVMEGDASMYGKAWLCGKAHLKGLGSLAGDSLADGSPVIEGNVIGDARIKGNSVLSKGADDWVCFTNVGSESGTLTVTKDKDGNLLFNRGCFHGTTEQFEKAVKAKHYVEGKPCPVYEEYMLLIQVAKLRLAPTREGQVKAIEELKKGHKPCLD